MNVCRGVVGLLLVSALWMPLANAGQGEEESGSCAWPLGADGYCVTIRLTDVDFLCDKTAVDYGCVMSGNVWIGATGPDDLPGYAGLWGFVDLDACPGVNGTCLNEERDIGLSCAWTTGGGCSAAGSFTHTLRSPLSSDACEEMFGMVSANGYVRVHEEIAPSLAQADLQAYGWYEDC